MIATRMPFVALAVLMSLGLLADVRAQSKPADTPAVAAESGKLVGILTHFEYNWTKINGPKPDTRVSLKAEGETDSVDYLLALPNEPVDPKLEKVLQKVFPSNTVNLQWQTRDGQRLVTNITVLTPTGGRGTIVGTLMARDNGSVDLKGSDRRAITTRYVVPWDVAAKGPNPAVANSLKDLNVGDKVKVAWSANPERLWVNQVQLVSRAPAAKPTTGSASETSKITEPKPAPSNPPKNGN